MVVAVSKEIARAHEKFGVRPRVRKVLKWAMLVQGKQAVTAAWRGDTSYG